MARPTRLNEDLALRLARHVAEGGSLRGAGKALGEKLGADQICRWRAQRPDFRALLAAAALLAAVRVFGDCLDQPFPPTPGIESVADLAREAIYGSTPGLRREATSILRWAVLGPWQSHLDRGFARQLDGALAEAWDAA